MWKCVGLWVGFWIKWKFQDTSLHHTSLTPHAEHWSHYFLLKENITDSQVYVRGARMKRLLHAKGEIDPCGCSNTLMIVCLPWLFDFTWLFIQEVGLLHFHVTLHWLTVWPIVEMWTTWLDMTVLVHACHCWCACWALVLLGDGCLHGVSQLHLRMAKCAKSLMVIGSLDVAFTHFSLLVCW